LTTDQAYFPVSHRQGGQVKGGRKRLQDCWGDCQVAHTDEGFFGL